MCLLIPVFLNPKTHPRNYQILNWYIWPLFGLDSSLRYLYSSFPVLQVRSLLHYRRSNPYQMHRSSRTTPLVHSLAGPYQRIDCSRYCLHRLPNPALFKNSTSCLSTVCCLKWHLDGMEHLHSALGQDLVLSFAQNDPPSVAVNELVADVASSHNRPNGIPW